MLVRLLTRRRFIPTPVGNTTVGRARPYSTPVHPHARGEHSCPSCRPRSPSGSSPRPWGTLVAAQQALDVERFIPTPVGNTPTVCKPRCTATVHPHARGEHTRTPRAKSTSRGSSPRPWGTREPRFPLEVRGRFIPTPVGNTLRRWPAGMRSAVHPHARGEHVAPAEDDGRYHGSSPRPWGTQCAREGAFLGGRFIPTPVGNTPGLRELGTHKTVHPHARGEHAHMVLPEIVPVGSSPRPWGTPPRS